MLLLRVLLFPFVLLLILLGVRSKDVSMLLPLIRLVMMKMKMIRPTSLPLLQLITRT